MGRPTTPPPASPQRVELFHRPTTPPQPPPPRDIGNFISLLAVNLVRSLLILACLGAVATTAVVVNAAIHPTCVPLNSKPGLLTELLHPSQPNCPATTVAHTTKTAPSPKPKPTPKPVLAATLWLHFSCGGRPQCINRIGSPYGIDPQYPNALTPAVCASLIAHSALKLPAWNGSYGTWCKATPTRTKKP